eukprot:UN04173
MLNIVKNSKDQTLPLLLHRIYFHILNIYNFKQDEMTLILQSDEIRNPLPIKPMFKHFDDKLKTKMEVYGKLGAVVLRVIICKGSIKIQDDHKQPGPIVSLMVGIPVGYPYKKISVECDLIANHKGLFDKLTIEKSVRDIPLGRGQLLNLCKEIRKLFPAVPEGMFN